MPMRMSRVVIPGALAVRSGKNASREPARGLDVCDQAVSREESALTTLHPMAPNARRRFISGLPMTQGRHDLVGVEQRDEAIAPAQAAQRARDVGLVGGVPDLEDVVERLEPDDVVDQEAHVSASAAVLTTVAVALIARTGGSP